MTLTDGENQLPVLILLRMAAAGFEVTVRDIYTFEIRICSLPNPELGLFLCR